MSDASPDSAVDATPCGEADCPDLPVAVDLGTDHACTRFESGRVMCWGSNQRGALGLDAINPSPVVDMPLLAPASDLATGQNMTCVVRAGTVQCRGLNSTGLLGDGTTVDSSVLSTTLRSATQVSAGFGGHACAVSSSGQAYCWGSNTVGQLGIGTPMTRVSVATEVVDLADATEVAVGASHTCAVREDRTLSCWGNNGSGQLGDGTTDDSRRPTGVPGVTGVAQLVAGVHHTCARFVDGTVSCWGWNRNGQLGDGTTLDRLTPVTTGLSGVTAITAGNEHTCAVLAGGVATCWGKNDAAQVGDGTMESPRVTPTLVRDLGPSVALAAGGATTCALRATGAILCWGREFDGRPEGAVGLIRLSPTTELDAP